MLLQLLQRRLLDEPALGAGEKQILYDAFAAADSSDLPSFRRNLAPLCHDLTFFRARALFEHSAVF